MHPTHDILSENIGAQSVDHQLWLVESLVASK
jgi:hypothetical protein